MNKSLSFKFKKKNCLEYCFLTTNYYFFFFILNVLFWYQLFLLSVTVTSIYIWKNITHDQAVVMLFERLIIYLHWKKTHFLNGTFKTCVNIFKEPLHEDITHSLSE